MRPYVEQVYGWNDADQVRRFDEHFDPSKNRVIVFEGEGAGEVWVANVQVSPEYQRRGIGAAVIGSVLADAHGRNLPVTLQVLEINPARALYERLGFRICGETVTHYRMRADPP